MNATDLLADFRDTRSESAFGELVRRYTDLIYSVALRRLSNVALAQEVPQLVFIRLARSAPRLTGEGALVGWLHRTTVHVSIDLWRAETRRRLREEQAVAMRSNPTTEASWTELAPALDEALDALNEADRQTLLLRFFEQKPMRDLGACFGISEDAAKMRVSRALDRLREQLGARHVTCSALALGALMADHSVEAAPGPVVAGLAAMSLPIAGGGSFTGLLTSLARVARTRWVFVPAVVVCGVLTTLLIRALQPAPQAAMAMTSAAKAMPVEPMAAATAGVEAATASADEQQPDPLKLLQAVAQARYSIASGTVEFQLISHHTQRGQLTESNQLQFKVAFDGSKLRWEQAGRVFRYTAMGDAATEQEARIQQEGLDKAAAVRAGLLQGFEARDVKAYDGTVLLTYREIDGKSSGADIEDSDNGGSHIFDPRCLGLRPDLGAQYTVEQCLAYEDAKSIRLVGKESVEGIPAWHIEVKSRYDSTLGFWLEVGQPTRVLKCANGLSVAVSTYEPLTTRPPIPMEVRTHHSQPSHTHKEKWTRTATQFNVPIDPASFTLAGLGMAVGSSVSDDRVRRRIGYWTGAGLSENLPAQGTETPPAPDLGELVVTLDSAPASSNALEAAVWILLNTPDGPVVEKAAAVILREHTANTNLTHLCCEMDRVRHRCATNLLEAILMNNPNAETRATACFVLATLFKAAANHGQNKAATALADKYFERVITEFGRSGRGGAELARRAKPELHELRHVLLGQPAPETEGVDLEGRPMNLRDYRGSVLVLAFWKSSVAADAAELRKLAGRAAGKSFAIVGVNGDEKIERAQASAARHEMPWPSFWDRHNGPIFTGWNVTSWLNVIVLDRQGVIRFRGYPSREFHDTVTALVAD